MEQEQTTQLMHYDFHLDTGEEYQKKVLEFASDEEAYESMQKAIIRHVVTCTIVIQGKRYGIRAVIFEKWELIAPIFISLKMNKKAKMSINHF